MVDLCVVWRSCNSPRFSRTVNVNDGVERHGSIQMSRGHVENSPHWKWKAMLTVGLR